MSEPTPANTPRMQVGVGLQTRDGDTEWHPCANDKEAWDLYSALTAIRPGALVWVGAVPAEESP